MRMLRYGLTIASATVLLIACGDDDRPMSGDDSGVTMIDSGPRPDTGPLPDTGPPPDTGTPAGACPTGVCDLVAQTGCSAGEGCYLNGREPVCAAAGTGADGSTCSTPTDCMEGLTCAENVCRPWCCGSDSGCPTGQTCLITLVDDMGDPIGAGLCRLPDACDPLTQTGCMNATDGCYIAGADGTVLCATAGTGMQDDPCSANNDCAAGFTCATPTGGTAGCRAICDTADGDPGCPSGAVCAGFMGNPMPWGACLPMM